MYISISKYILKITKPAKYINIKYINTMHTMNIDEKIKQLIENNDVVLFLKGSKNFPQCGFSGRAIQILKTFNITFLDVNVLADPEIREGIKTYSNWPTIPQLYIKGEFIGGSDIMYEMYQSGEFKQCLEDAGLITK